MFFIKTCLHTIQNSVCSAFKPILLSFANHLSAEMENSKLYNNEPCQRSSTLDHLITSVSISNFSLIVFLANDPSTVVFPIADLLTDLPSTIGLSITISSTTFPSTTFYPPANSYMIYNMLTIKI